MYVLGGSADWESRQETAQKTASRQVRVVRGSNPLAGISKLMKFHSLHIVSVYWAGKCVTNWGENIWKNSLRSVIAAWLNISKGA